MNCEMRLSDGMRDCGGWSVFAKQRVAQHTTFDITQKLRRVNRLLSRAAVSFAIRQSFLAAILDWQDGGILHSGCWVKKKKRNVQMFSATRQHLLHHS